MNTNEFYAVYFKNKLVAVISEEELSKLTNNKIADSSKDIKINRISKDELEKFNSKDIRRILTKEERKKLEEELFVKEIVENIKKEGITLRHPLKECIDDISPYAKWADKLKKDKEKIREQSFGREKE